MDYQVYSLAELSSYAPDTSLLPAAEQRVAAQRGEQYARIRSLLRQELQRRTSIPAPEIPITFNQHGKPECNAQPFNLSHSGDCLCMAFHHTAIGVDVERMRPRRFESLAARFMAPEQLGGFLSRDCPPDEFYACWCAAEALVKQAGDTMWNARQYPFVYYSGRIHCLFDGAPAIMLFTPMPGYQGAVAYHP